MTYARRRPPFGRLLLTALLAPLTVLLGPLAEPAGAAAPWIWPVDPARVVHDFDPPEDPWGSGHRGVDLAASVGQEVRAPAEGTVTFAGVIAGRGVVVVSHGEVRTTYEPVAGALPVGAVVQQGDRIGAVQRFAHHCALPCLHWGAIRGTEYVDPTSFVVVPPSRLLPVWDDGGRGGSASTEEQGASGVIGRAVEGAPARASPHGTAPGPASWSAGGQESDAGAEVPVTAVAVTAVAGAVLAGAAVLGVLRRRG